MEDKNDLPTEEENEEKEKVKTYIEKKNETKEKKVAKDLVTLTHVETQKQKISPEARDLAQALKESYLEHDQFERLTNDEITILETFMGKRLFLERIAIIANQSRMPLGIPGLKRAELEEIIESLVSKNYIESEMVGDKPVYFLTERGKYRVQ
ncbi:MAG: hypothetical protein JSV62_06045 [Promethearchaeota archaeon]|nr:MAG: hypothetical protein JSV62_06045 [Candidatus Lokiarchaeota archaeon]